MVFDLTQGTRSQSIFDIGMNESKVRFPDFQRVHSVTNTFLNERSPSWDKKCKLLMTRTRCPGPGVRSQDAKFSGTLALISSQMIYGRGNYTVSHHCPELCNWHYWQDRPSLFSKTLLQGSFIKCQQHCAFIAGYQAVAWIQTQDLSRL